MRPLTWIWALMAIAGLLLQTWACAVLPKGTSLRPVPIVTRTHRGPYRWMKHPMYAGNTIQMVGLGGLAAGPWNALALGGLMQTVNLLMIHMEES